MFRKLLVAISAMALLSSGAAEAKKKPTMTPMELQAIQSKEFEVKKDDLFSAVMTVTQDLGYQVESADLQTGFITAASATENKTGFFEAFAGMSSSGNTRMTAYIQQMPNKMSKVRLNFLNSKTARRPMVATAVRTSPFSILRFTTMRGKKLTKRFSCSTL